MAYRDSQSWKLSGAMLLAGCVALASLTTARAAWADDKDKESAAAKTTEDKKKPASQKKADKADPPNARQLKARDPFVVPARIKFEPPKEVKKEPKPISPPSMETRLSEYRNSVRMASINGQAAPDKLSAYLVEELTITGTFRDSKGDGAFVLAGPTKLTFFARVGMRTHDGVIKEVTPTGIKFVKKIPYDDGSVRQVEEFRALRSGK